MANYDDLFKAPVDKKENTEQNASTSEWAAEQKAAYEAILHLRKNQD